MGGAQPLAVTLNGGVCPAVEVEEARAARRVESGYCDRLTRSMDEALAWAKDALAARRGLGIALIGNAAETHAEFVRRGLVPDVATDQTSAHDPLNGYVPAGLSLEQAAALRVSNATEYTRRARESMAAQVRALLAMKAGGTVLFDYGNNLRGEAERGGLAHELAFSYPGFVPEYIRPLFCVGKGPFRWVALSGDPEDILATDRAALEEFPDDARLHRWIPLSPRSTSASRGCRPASAGSDTARRARLGLRFNRMVRDGVLKAPIVIGRDHLDTGSVASPWRETEGMKDGSDAVADWPILERAAERGRRRDVGQRAPRRRRGDRQFDPRGRGDRLRRQPGDRRPARARAHERSRHRRHAPRGRGLPRRGRARAPHRNEASRHHALSEEFMSLLEPRDPSSRTVAGRTSYLLLHNTSEVVTPDADGTTVFLSKPVVFQAGRVLEVGPAVELSSRHREARPLNANGRLVTPGLVDCHTHMLFAGHRAGEFQRRLKGESYASIAAAGGGIRATVNATVNEREDTLEKSLANRLERWRANGCTTVEVKSGYGLMPNAEVRMLEIMRGGAHRVPGRVHRTALLLHALPDAYATRREAYLEDLCERTLPEIRRRDLATSVDAFCEDVAFSVAECRQLLTRAKALGFPVKLHADQLTRNGGAQLAAELGALSADHLEQATEEDWQSLAAAGTVGVLLPAAALTLGQRLPEAAMLRRAGARWAIATDFNPGTAPAQSLLECASLAARLCGFDAEETLRAITWNAAKALGVEREVGHLTHGAWGDAVVWECESLEELPYWMPAVRPDTVFMRGADLALPSVERRIWP
jgi:imidazolonepropionase